MIVEAVRERVRAACLDERNVFGPAFYEEHVVVVADVASRLALALGADAEAVELAAWLHDLSAVCDPATLPAHANASAELGARILREYGCPEATVRTVAEAVVAHSEPLAIGSAPAEAVCLSNADAAARILRPAYWLYFAFAVRQLPFAEGRTWLRGLFERQWEMLIEPAREIVRDDFERAMRL